MSRFVIHYTCGVYIKIGFNSFVLKMMSAFSSDAYIQMHPIIVFTLEANTMEICKTDPSDIERTYFIRKQQN